MNVLTVSAHDDNASFTAAMQYSALSVLERAGHTVAVTDLYSQKFNPVATTLDFKTKSVEHANYMFEQLRAINTGVGLSPDIETEIQKIKSADILIFHFPLWWSGVPALMKGWFDRVLANGFAWDKDHKYSNGLLRGKKVLLTIGVGDPQSFYSAEGIHGATVEQHLYGLTHSTLALCGLDVLQPYIFYNLTAAAKEELEQKLKVYQQFLTTLEQSESYIYKHTKEQEPQS